MTRAYVFGQYPVQLQGDPRTLALLPPEWARFSAPSPAPASAVIRVETAPELAPGQEGWSPRGEHAALYTTGRNPLFTLRCDPDAVTLGLKEPVRGLRMGLLYAVLLSLRAECVGVHGVTLLCGDEILLLSAPSGTGKTTLAGLLERYADALVINGDFAMLSLTGEGVMFEPTPFCGTSGRCLNQRVPLHRIVFLGQAKDSQWKALTGRQAMVSLLSNAFVPTWDGELERIARSHLMQVLSRVPADTFAFAPDRGAAEAFCRQDFRS